MAISPRSPGLVPVANVQSLTLTSEPWCFAFITLDR
jgi:hypothetical protein